MFPSICLAMDLPQHFLLECHDLVQIRDRYYPVNSLLEYFPVTPSSSIVNYLHETGLYSEIY